MARIPHKQLVTQMKWIGSGKPVDDFQRYVLDLHEARQIIERMRGQLLAIYYLINDLPTEEQKITYRGVIGDATKFLFEKSND